MKVQFTESDIVVAASAYDQQVVRVETPDDVFFYLVEKDANMEPTIVWKGSLESCLATMASSETMQIALATPPILRTPDEGVNALIERVA